MPVFVVPQICLTFFPWIAYQPMLYFVRIIIDIFIYSKPGRNQSCYPLNLNYQRQALIHICGTFDRHHASCPQDGQFQAMVMHSDTISMFSETITSWRPDCSQTCLDIIWKGTAYMDLLNSVKCLMTRQHLVDEKRCLHFRPESTAYSLIHTLWYIYHTHKFNDICHGYNLNIKT